MFAGLFEKLIFPGRSSPKEESILKDLCLGTNYKPVLLGRNINGRHEHAMFLTIEGENGISEPKYELRIKKSWFKTTYELYEKSVDERGRISSKLFDAFYDLTSLKKALTYTPLDDDILAERFRPTDEGNMLANNWTGNRLAWGKLKKAHQ